MRLSKTISLQPTTWELIEKYMKKINIKEISIAIEQLILAGAEAKKEQEANSK